MSASASADREHVGDGTAVDREAIADRGDDPPGDGAGAGDGDLLTDDRAHGGLERVDAAGHAQARAWR